MYNLGFGCKRIVEPVADVVTVDEAKLHMRVDISDDDHLIETLVKAATEYCENYTSRAFITQTWLLALDKFPGTVFDVMNFDDWPRYQDIIRLPRASPLQSVVTLNYIDTTQTLVTMASNLYQIDSVREPARIRPAPGVIWPVTYMGYFGVSLDAVQVTYTAGYGDSRDAVPDGIKAAIKMLVASWYFNRESVTPTPLTVVPMAVESLLSMHATGQYS